VTQTNTSYFIVGLIAFGHKPISTCERTSVRRRLDRLQSWGLIDRQGRHYYLHGKTLNSFIGMRSYQQVRRILTKATEELAVLDSEPSLKEEAA
jgi:DNA-binding IclR family transcriptional regulator